MVSFEFLQAFQAFLLVFARMTGMFVVAPFFSSVVVPLRFKLVLVFFITVILFPLVGKLGMKVEMSLVPYIMQLTGEVLVGIAFGFFVATIFAAVQFAAELFSMQMGLSISMVFDPQTQIEVPIVGQLLSLFALLVFLAVNGHHHLIAGVYKSYAVLPFFDFASGATLLAKGAGEAFVRMFGAAILIGLPVIAVALLLSVVMGILAKTAPQLNVLMMGFPIQIAVGIGVLVLALPLMFRAISVLIEDAILFTLRALGGSG